MYRYLVIISCLGALVAEAVYLPGSPPLPLRFQVRSEGRAELPLVLPPVPLTNELVTITNYVEVTNYVTVTFTNVVGANPLAGLATNPSPVVTNAMLIAPLPEAQPLSPAVLMQYFRDRQGTNHAGATIVTPVGFAPPPAPVPSSSATYEKK